MKLKIKPKSKPRGKQLPKASNKQVACLMLIDYFSDQNINNLFSNTLFAGITSRRLKDNHIDDIERHFRTKAARWLAPLKKMLYNKGLYDDVKDKEETNDTEDG